jgi:hypothetical protein
MSRDVKEGSPLPAPDTTRWTHRRKAAVVIGVRAGTITRSEVNERYKLSHEELTAWEEAFDRYGIDGLILKTRRWLLSREGKSEPPLRTSSPTQPASPPSFALPVSPSGERPDPSARSAAG